jgi:hypothetical protein
VYEIDWRRAAERVWRFLPYVLVLVVVCMLFAWFMPTPEQKSPDITIQGGTIEAGSLLPDLFKKDYEQMYLIFDDLSYVMITSYDPKYITGSLIVFFDFLKDHKLDLKRCVSVVHNHPYPTPFSDEDIETYRTLRANGFNGLFFIYYPKYKRILVYRGSQK